MKNEEISGIFRDIADLLERKKENWFKIRAYRKVADSIDGLVDEVGFIEDAIDRAIAMADLNKDKVRVVTYRAPITLMDALTASRAPDVQFDVDSLLELSAPRAYYLVTSIPPLVSTYGE